MDNISRSARRYEVAMNKFQVRNQMAVINYQSNEVLTQSSHWNNHAEM